MAATTSPAPARPSAWSSGAPTRRQLTATAAAATTTATPTSRGFSLTHLSGAGCSLYGDFPFLPTTEPLAASPVADGSALKGQFQPGFSHARESGRPGYYSVRLNPVRGGAIETELTATTRTGMARFTFPRGRRASVLINAGGSAQPDDFAAVNVDPARREIDGTASSGLFCGQRPRYRVYIAAVFDRPFAQYGTWEGSKALAGSTTASDSQAPPTNPRTSAEAGAYASFDTRRNRTVTARVGVSFVSVEAARANLAAENPGLSFGAIASRAEQSWNSWLGRIRLRGGARRALDTFYTALYHVGLAPAYLQRRRRHLHRHGRAAAPGRGPRPVRRFLRLGHLPHADPVALDPRPQASERDRTLAARRRRREWLPATLVLRQRPEHDDGRRLGRSPDRLGRRLRRHCLRPPRRARRDAARRRRRVPQRQRRIPRAPGPGAIPRPWLRALRPRYQRSQRQLDLWQSRRRLGLGRQLARVHGRRFRDRPVRRPHPRRPRHLQPLYAAFRQLAQALQPLTAA